jgi:hypothetical protein
MNEYEMHNMVEFIKTQAEFPFDAADMDESVEAVLGYFGFNVQLDESEREQLRQDVYPLALAEELAEMHHLAELEADAGLEGIGKPSVVWLRVMSRQPRSISPARFMENLRLR